MNRSERLKLALIGAVVGGFIGPVVFLLRERLAVYSLYGKDGFPFPGPANEWLKNIGGLAKVGALRTFAIIAFIATLVLMPAFLGWLERRANRSTGRFYLVASIGGIVFGIFATVLTAWGIFIALMFVSQSSGTAVPKSVPVLMFAAGIFGPFVGLAVALVFIAEIAVVGIPFGAGFGALVRAHVRRNVPPAS